MVSSTTSEPQFGPAWEWYQHLVVGRIVVACDNSRAFIRSEKFKDPTDGRLPVTVTIQWLTGQSAGKREDVPWHYIERCITSRFVEDPEVVSHKLLDLQRNNWDVPECYWTYLQKSRAQALNNGTKSLTQQQHEDLARRLDTGQPSGQRPLVPSSVPTLAAAAVDASAGPPGQGVTCTASNPQAAERQQRQQALQHPAMNQPSTSQQHASRQHTAEQQQQQLGTQAQTQSQQQQAGPFGAKITLKRVIHATGHASRSLLGDFIHGDQATSLDARLKDASAGAETRRDATADAPSAGVQDAKNQSQQQPPTAAGLTEAQRSGAANTSQLPVPAGAGPASQTDRNKQAAARDASTAAAAVIQDAPGRLASAPQHGQHAAQRPTARLSPVTGQTAAATALKPASRAQQQGKRTQQKQQAAQKRQQLVAPPPVTDVEQEARRTDKQAGRVARQASNVSDVTDSGPLGIANVVPAAAGNTTSGNAATGGAGASVRASPQQQPCPASHPGVKSEPPVGVNDAAVGPLSPPHEKTGEKIGAKVRNNSNSRQEPAAAAVAGDTGDAITTAAAKGTRPAGVAKATRKQQQEEVAAGAKASDAPLPSPSAAQDTAPTTGSHTPGIVPAAAPGGGLKDVLQQQKDNQAQAGPTTVDDVSNKGDGKAVGGGGENESRKKRTQQSRLAGATNKPAADRCVAAGSSGHNTAHETAGAATVDKSKQVANQPVAGNAGVATCSEDVVAGNAGKGAGGSKPATRTAAASGKGVRRQAQDEGRGVDQDDSDDAVVGHVTRSSKKRRLVMSDGDEPSDDHRATTHASAQAKSDKAGYMRTRRSVDASLEKPAAVPSNAKTRDKKAAINMTDDAAVDATVTRRTAREKSSGVAGSSKQHEARGKKQQQQEEEEEESSDSEEVEGTDGGDDDDTEVDYGDDYEDTSKWIKGWTGVYYPRSLASKPGDYPTTRSETDDASCGYENHMDYYVDRHNKEWVLIKWSGWELKTGKGEKYLKSKISADDGRGHWEPLDTAFVEAKDLAEFKQWTKGEIGPYWWFNQKQRRSKGK